ncbi:MAG TPA: tRNA pseudouridine(13) synthase TruD [Candidatus Nanoarchaeia archaeon]|nr:tRNA pseudouridine(13) synthase TruD [Candidatus Nanoarchaeia archaeon]
MAVIKFVPEDFLVREIPLAHKPGKYHLFMLKKKNLTTLEAIGRIAEKLSIKPSEIGFAGNKDKNAVTEQLVSIKNVSRKKIEGLNAKCITLKFFGTSEKPLYLGSLSGNEFRIVIRDLDELQASSLKNSLKLPNFFGQQRFSELNADIGLLMLKKGFKTACELIAEKDGVYGPQIKSYLSENKKDFINALKLIPHNILKLYIHSFQSAVWNEAVKICDEKGIFKNEIPLAGYGTELEDDEVGAIISEILKKHDLKTRDFVIKEFPFLSSEGGQRKMLLDVYIKVAEISDDEFHKGRKKAVVEFSLPKSSYATVVIKHLLG